MLSQKLELQPHPVVCSLPNPILVGCRKAKDLPQILLPYGRSFSSSILRTDLTVKDRPKVAGHKERRQERRRRLQRDGLRGQR